MKTKELIDALNICAKVKRNSIDPIYNCVAFNEDGSLETTNLNQSIKVQTQFKLHDFCVDLDALLMGLKAVRSEDVYINLDHNRLHIAHDDGRFELATFERDDFPFPDHPEAYTQAFDVEKVNTVQHAISKDASKFVLNSVFSDGAGAVSTDGRRLSLHGSPNGASVILPMECVRLITSIYDDNIKSQIDRGNIYFKSGDVMIQSKLTEGNFPAHEKLIPSDLSQEAQFSKSDLKFAVNAVSVFSEGDVPSVTLDMKGDRCKLYSHGQTRSSDVEITSLFTGDATITVNSSYLMDAIHAFDTEDLVIKYLDSEHPVMIERGDQKEIIMPMRGQ